MTGSQVGMNPYGYGNYYNSGVLTDDFMANQYFSNKYSVNPDLFCGAGPKQPKVDTFEKQSSSSNTGTGILLGAGAGVGTGLAVNKWFTNPVGEKELTKGFADKFSKEYTDIIRKNATETVYKSHGKLNADIMKELDDFAFHGDASKLSKAAKKVLTSEGVAANQTAVENFVKGINNDIANIVDPKDFNLQTQKLQNIQKVKEGLKGTATEKVALEKFLTENAEHLGLKGADEAATKTNIKNFLNKDRFSALDPAKQMKIENSVIKKAKELGLEGKNPAETSKNIKNYINQMLSKAEVTKTLNTSVKAQEAVTKNATGVLDEVFGLWNKDRKAFKAGSTKEITQACEKSLSKFKWQKAGLWGAIAAGVVVAGSWLLGGSSAPAKA